MIKKIFTLILVCCFLSFVISPTYAYADEPTPEEDRDQERKVRALIGGVALVGILFMLSKMGKSDFAESLIEKKKDSNKGFKFGIHNYGIESNYSAAKNEIQTPLMGITYSW